MVVRGQEVRRSNVESKSVKRVIERVVGAR